MSATPNTQITLLDEDAFEKAYQPVMTPGSNPDDGEFLWDHTQVERLAQANHQGNIDRHVWTVVEIEDGSLVALPGWHGVNAIGHLVTALPWPHEGVEVRWFDAGDLDG